MFKSGSKHLPIILVLVISFTFVGFALAQEADVMVETEVNVAPSGPIRPLDLARQKAMEIKQNAINAKAQLRADTSADWQNASTAPEKRALMQGAMEDRRDIARDRMASTTNLMQKVRGVIYQHAGVIKQRFVLAMRHFEQFVERIETRIDKMAAAGVDTASVEAQLEVAKTAQASAKADIQAVNDFVESIDETSDRAQVRPQLQALVKTANESIKEAHQALQATIRALVALTKEQRPEADASASVEAEVEVETANQ